MANVTNLNTKDEYTLQAAVKFAYEGASTNQTSYKTIENSAIPVDWSQVKTPDGEAYTRLIAHVMNEKKGETTYIRISDISGTEASYTAQGKLDWQLVRSGWVDVSGRSSNIEKLGLKVSGGRGYYNSAIIQVASKG